MPDDATLPPLRRWPAQHLGRLLAVLAFLGGALGSLNLVVGDVLRDGWARPVYASMMVLCVVLGVVLWFWPVVLRHARLPLVLLADGMYLVIATTIVDAHLYATPLMLLFATILAAWVLGPRSLPVHLVAVYLICWVALAPTISDGALLAVQVVVQGSVLNSTAVVVLLLRRRQKLLLRHMHAASVTDTLTGLPNRRHLEERSPDLWARADRGDLQLAALVIDLDHFKRVNDEHGHAVGDELLRRVGTALRSTVRADDLVVRTGGEEFVVLTAVENADPVVALAERVRAAVSAVDEATRPTASIGIALSRGPVVEPVDATWRLVDQADMALYEAKRRGRNRSVLLDRSGTVPEPRREPDQQLSR
ncbi:MAG TPA: GGDEF domain-containing protein [Actinomycetales bacterium]|nr:GGDEF domain-containing protein [Actinomycetales bacterium]